MAGKTRILLVDEHDDDRALASLTLRHFLEDADVIEVGEAIGFAEELAGDAFDVIVADSKLSWGSGTQVVALARKFCPDTLGFLLTDASVESVADQGFPLRIDGFFRKDSRGYMNLPAAVSAALSDRKAGVQQAAHSGGPRLDALPVGIFSLDGEGRIRSANPALLGTLATPASPRLLGRVMESFFQSDERRRTFRELIASRRHIREFDAEIERPDGHRGWVRVTATPANGGASDQDAYEGVVQDITEFMPSGDRGSAKAHELEHSNQELEQIACALSNKARTLERTNEELEQIAYALSHDLQEPLQLMARNARYLSDRYRGKLEGDAERFLGHLIDSASRMQIMIEGVLNFSRLGPKGLQMQPLDLQDVVGEVVNNMQPVLSAADAEVVYHDLPTVNADRRQMLQLFQNLIGNAIKFRGTEALRVRVTATETPKEWRVAVTDNGIGLDPADRGRIFGMFQRLHTQEEYPGTGIGLAMCKRIAEAHGGEIAVDSARGRGATFTVTLPKHESVLNYAGLAGGQIPGG